MGLIGNYLKTKMQAKMYGYEVKEAIKEMQRTPDERQLERETNTNVGKQFSFTCILEGVSVNKAKKVLEHIKTIECGAGWFVFEQTSKKLVFTNNKSDLTLSYELKTTNNNLLLSITITKRGWGKLNLAYKNQCEKTFSNLINNMVRIFGSKNKSNNNLMNTSFNADELKKLHSLMIKGIITKKEFDKAKKKLIS